MAHLFTRKEISLGLKAIPKWSHQDQSIVRTYKFKGFLKAIKFVGRIARKAQKMDHHPDIDIRFNKVTLTLSSHDEGGITQKDFSLAQKFDEVFSK